MTNKSLELVKRSLENALILMDDVRPPLSSADKNTLKQIREYAITLINEINRLL